MLTRFAPSPTGYLHIGNIRTALICYLYAKKAGGKFMLRIDDTDTKRSEEKFVTAIKEDLAWLGINFDLTMRQSERFDRYNEVIKHLKEIGRLYPCFETADELEFKRKIQLGRGLPPVYDRSSLKLSKQDIENFITEGKKPHYRFLLEDKQIEWDDEIRGKISLSPASMSDPILVRENGEFTYMLPSTIDDIDFNATHILRGEDHISNTAIQIQIFNAMGAKIPNFAHNSLVKTKEGKISKREGKGGVAELREKGVQPMVLNSFLAKLGTSDAIDLKENLQQLVDEFDIKKFGLAPTLYDVVDIFRLNTKALHGLSYEAVKNKIPTEIPEKFWDKIKGNIESLNDVEKWWIICTQNFSVSFSDEDKAFLNEAAKLLPEGEITSQTWDIWINEIKAKTGRKGKQLFMPIRLALTGVEHGPEMKEILEFIGRERVLWRLN
jgi:glutamyl-tRNA synthetase